MMAADVSSAIYESELPAVGVSAIYKTIVASHA